MPVPFPETESGIEIRLLKHLFDEEEAKIALKLSALPEPIDKIHGRFTKGEITKDHLISRLNLLAQKGAIMASTQAEKDAMFSKIPLAIGIFEYQVDRITKDFAEDFFNYEDEAFGDALLKGKTKQMRTIPVNVRIDPEFSVGNYDNIRALIDKSPGPFAVMNCVCRQARDLMGDSCKQTDIMETCFTLEKAAIFMMGRGVARDISKDEMIRLVTRAEKEGMVLQPANTQEPGFICCCCGCCCGVLTAAKKFPEPAEVLQSNFYAKIDAINCTACGDCIEICQMEALEFVNSHTEVFLSHCIGCGNCINVCPSDAISLMLKEKEIVPPKNIKEMYMKMIRERYGALGSAKIIGKAMLGKQI